MSSPNENPVGDETFDYNDRYGVTRKRSWILPAVIVAIIGIPWTIWAALDHSQPELRSTLYSFSISGEREITMRYGIERRNPQDVVTCTLVTLDIDKNIVGQIDDQIEGGEKKVIRTVAIPARLSPVSARIVSCRIS